MRQKVSVRLAFGDGMPLGARVARPARAAIRRSRACYPNGDPSLNQAGLATRAPKSVRTNSRMRWPRSLSMPWTTLSLAAYTGEEG